MLTARPAPRAASLDQAQVNVTRRTWKTSWAAAEGLSSDLAELAAHERVRAAIQQDLDNANRRYPQVGQIKRFAIPGHNLSQEGGELTPTLKVERHVVHDRSAEVFGDLYAQD